MERIDCVQHEPEDRVWVGYGSGPGVKTFLDSTGSITLNTHLSLNLIGKQKRMRTATRCVALVLPGGEVPPVNFWSMNQRNKSLRMSISE
ncbi:hypothetical protein V6Z88_006105 [Aspergillus fumigatus]